MTITYTRLYANNAKTTLASPIGASDTSIILTDASSFPVPGTNQEFTITIDSGSGIEIVLVRGVSGNVLTSCIRGQEGTTPQSFITGTRVENRVTAGTLGAFARLVDRVANISSVDLLDTPTNSAGNTYLCASTDDGGTPILVVKNGSLWRFLNHPTKILDSASTGIGTTTTMPLAGASNLANVTSVGSHIIQFTGGLNAGLSRIIQSTNMTTVAWTAALPYAVASGDSFHIYESSAFTLNYIKTSADDALIFSILFGD